MVKSSSSATASASSGAASSSTNDPSAEYDLPKANMNRLIKKGLPEGISLVGDARTAFSKAAVVFVLYLTAT